MQKQVLKKGNENAIVHAKTTKPWMQYYAILIWNYLISPGYFRGP